MLCFRCGSPVGERAESCANCGQDLTASRRDDTERFTELQRKLRKTGRHAARATVYGVGAVVRERYEVVDVVGPGPLGTVYKAFDQELEVDVALKLVDAEFLPDEGSRAAFLTTIGRLREMVHPNAVRYFDVDRDGDRCFFVTQFLEGLSLRKIVELRRTKGQRFSLAEVEPIATQLCRALGETCSLVVHGGLKPDNVIILPDVLKITDFALPLALPQEAYLAAQRSAGDVFLYHAPEVRNGQSPDARADVYSAGAILLELLTGQLFRGQAVLLDEADLTLRKGLETVLRRALAAQPHERYAHAGELGEAVVQAMKGGEAPPAREELEERTAVKKTQRAPLDGPTAVQNMMRVPRPEATAVEPRPARGPREGSSHGEAPTTLRGGTASDPALMAAAEGEWSALLGGGTGEHAAPLENSDPHAAPRAKEHSQATHQLKLEELEVDEAEEGLGGVSAGQSDDEGVEVADAPRKEHSQATHQLKLDELEFEEASARRAAEAGDRGDPESGRAADRDLTVPRAAVLSPLLAAESGPTIPEKELPEAASAPTEGTQQIHMDMILGADEDAAAPESERGPSMEQRQRMAVSGEVGRGAAANAASAAPAQDPELPHLDAAGGGRRAHREARAREALQAFGRTKDGRPLVDAAGVIEGIGGSGEMPAPLAELAGRGAEAGAMGAASSSPGVGGVPSPLGASPAVAPEVLHRDAVPVPLAPREVTLAVPRRAAPVRRWALPAFVGAMVALGAGTVATIVYVHGQREAEKREELERKQQALRRQQADASPVTPTVSARGLGATAPDRGMPGRASDAGGSHTRVTLRRGDGGSVGAAEPEGRERDDRLGGSDDPSRAAARTARTPSEGSGKADRGRCYAGMAYVARGASDGYCIDRFEAPGRGAPPLRSVTVAASRAACRARGLRLCSMAEWTRACGGRFPYGETFDKRRCSTGMDKPGLAGGRPSCRSAHQVYDLSGNVSEWVEEGVAMGGDFTSRDEAASCAAKGKGGPNTGYRCCGDPDWE
ncbi:MAG: protein kinase [Deltaproteobacteria bacterium]|nr:protein kinase [Deltaproteobacteria bacterium]